MKRSPASALAPLALGLALGAGTTWAVRHTLAPTPSTPTATPASGSSPAITHHPSYITHPPRLAGPEADAVLSAWLALPPLSSDAPDDEIAPRLARLRALLTLLPDSHFEKLFAALATRVGGAEARLRRLAFQVWTERDAPAATRWAFALTPGEAINVSTRERYLFQATEAWARTDFEAAYAWLATVSDAKFADRLARDLLARLIATDPARALALARARSAKFVTDQRRSLFDAYAKIDPGAAVRELGSELTKDDLRNSHVQDALTRWLAREPQAAFDWILGRAAAPDMEQQNLLQSLTWSLGRDSTAALAAVGQLLARPDLPNQRELILNVTRNWVQTDPAATLAWLDGIPDLERRNELIEQHLFALPSDRFFDYVHRLPDSPARAKHIENFLVRWAQTAPDAAFAWLDAHSDEPGLAAVADRVQGASVVKLAQTDPAAALARWETLPPGTGKTEAAGPLARSWADRDPFAAAAWLAPQISAENLTADQRRTLERNYLAIAGRLALTDPAAVMRMAEANPDPSTRANAYYALANDSAFDTNNDWKRTSVPHATRADLLATIPEEKDRTATLTILLGHWLQRDHDAGRAWIDSHDILPAEDAARLLDRADPLAPASY